LAGERDQILGATLSAADPSETVVVDAAVEEGEDGILDGAAPEAVASLEALLPRALDLVVALVDEGIEG
jgi:hypothetical protein